MEQLELDHERLDGVSDMITQTLRELECDSDVLTNSTEANLHYIIHKVLAAVYSSQVSDRYLAVGVLECVKHGIMQ